MENGEVRVPFGPDPWQTVPLPWAAALLRLFRDRDPARFGAYLAEVATGTKPALRSRG